MRIVDRPTLWTGTLASGLVLAPVTDTTEPDTVAVTDGSFFEMSPELYATNPTDQYFGNQWGLVNTGQFGGTAGKDINVIDVWDDYTGNGVSVGIIDDGIDYNHPDLDDN